MPLKILFSIFAFLFFSQTQASIEASWSRIESCNYSKNKPQQFIKDGNHISQLLATKHRNASDYSELEKTLSALFAPHPGPISTNTFNQVASCSAQMRIALLSSSTVQTKIQIKKQNWTGCYEKVYPKAHAVLVAAKKIEACIKKE